MRTAGVIVSIISCAPPTVGGSQSIGNHAAGATEDWSTRSRELCAAVGSSAETVSKGLALPGVRYLRQDRRADLTTDSASSWIVDSPDSLRKIGVLFRDRFPGDPTVVIAWANSSDHPWIRSA